jgi:hypothetical protein
MRSAGGERVRCTSASPQFTRARSQEFILVMSAVLVREAEAFDIPFHFNSAEDRQGHGLLDALRHNLRVRSGEALGVNVALQLHVPDLLAADTPGRQEVLVCVFAR